MTKAFRYLAASFVVVMGLVALIGSGAGGSNGYPIHLSVSAPSPGYVSLKWSIWANNPYEDYEILRDPYSSTGYSDYHCDSNGCSAIDKHVAPTARYCYQIVVRDPLFVYAESNEACVTTLGLAGWAIETIENGGNPALFLDSSNQPHVSYRNSRQSVVLAYKNGAGWQQSVVDSEMGYNGDTGVAVDSVGADHVSYLDYTNDLQMYATNGTGVWQTQVIDTSVGEVNALSIDNAGNVHIVYKILVTDMGVVGYATNTSGSWQTERLVEFSSESIRDADILVDAAGAVHLVFTSRAYGDFDCSIHYMSNQEGNWQREVVEERARCGVAMAMDTAENVHLAYAAMFQGYDNLLHADNSGGAWQLEPIEQIGHSFSWGNYPELDLTIDGADDLHVAYHDQYDNLKYATNTSGMWEFYFLDSSGTRIFINPSITVDPTGHVTIVYVYFDPPSYKQVRLVTSP